MWRLLAGLDAVFLFIVSVIPVPEGGPEIPYFDKLVHLCEYFLFAWLLARAFRAGPRAFRNAWSMAVGYGIAIELVQAMIPWRSAELLDAIANAIGAALGIYVAKMMVKEEVRRP